MTDSIEIEGRRIGRDARCFLIAEVGQAHDGSLGAAHAYIDAAADAGVDAIKFQTHLADAESTLDEPFRIRFSRQDESRFDYWKRMEFTEEQWAGLVAHTKERGIAFLSSAFSVPAVELLARLGLRAWKIGSGEVASRDLLNAMTAAGGPILLSSGMSGYAEISETVEWLRARGAAVALFQCTTRYPNTFAEVGLNVIDEFRLRFSCPVGLSDHSGTVFPALAAMAQGADLIEAHIVFDRRMFGPDAPASLTVDEFGFLVKARDAFAKMMEHPLDKDAAAAALAETRAIFGKSVAPVRDLIAGTVLTEEMLTLKKPGGGISAKELPGLVGCRLRRDVDARRLLSWQDLDV